MVKILRMHSIRLASPFIGMAIALTYGTLVIASTARADIAVIVSPKNMATWDSNNQNQVKDIFLGRLEKFPDGTAVKPVDQRLGSVRREFYLKLAGKDDIALNVYWSNLIFTGRGQPPKVIGDDNDVKKMVKDNPECIGYIDSKLVDNSVKVIYLVK
jgi:ABC-type phosphate transport system substrate-binding protein